MCADRRDPMVLSLCMLLLGLFLSTLYRTYPYSLAGNLHMGGESVKITSARISSVLLGRVPRRPGGRVWGSFRV